MVSIIGNMRKIKPEGKKKKGSRLERKVAQLIRLKGLDKNAGRQVLSGGDWAYRGDIRTSLPYQIECKNNERHNIWKEWEQAKDQEKPMKPAVLCISGNYRPILCMMEIDTFLNLVKEIKDSEENR
jgi:hypothetical protein